MSQITIGGTTLNFKDSAFTGDQWEQVASWVLNGGAEGIDANAQIATEKAAAASASAAAARNSATSAGESASAAARSAARAEGYNSRARSSAERAATSATNAASSERNAASSAATADSASYSAESAATEAASSQSAAKQSERNAKTYESNASSSANNARVSETKARTYASSAAESIKHAPRINSSGKWELWDATKNAYVTTEYTAIGKDGAAGTDGTTPHIGENGNWYIGSTDTGKPSRGAAGEKGDPGAKGEPGDPGATGPQGPKGADGITPTIGTNGNWFLGTTDTSKPSRGATGAKGDPGEPGAKGDPGEPGAAGKDGTTPHIGANGNWYIGETDTGVKAAGTSSVFNVIVTTGSDPDSLSANKTLAEIKSAYASGSMVVVRQSTVLYYLTYMSDVKAEFTYTDETYCYVLSCANYGAPSEADIWQLNRTKRLNYDTKYRDIGLKTVPGAIKELQDKASPAVTDADAGKYLHVNASKELEWAGLSFTDDGSGNISVDGATAQSVNRFLQSLTFPGLNFKYINPLNSGTYSSPYGVYVGSGASLVDTILAKTVPGVYTVYMNRNATDVPAAAAAASSSLRGLVVLSQIKKHYAIILLVDQLSNFYVQYIQNDVGGGWKQMPTSASGSDLPAVTAADAGKFLRVSSSGSWVAETVANANGGEF